MTEDALIVHQMHEYDSVMLNVLEDTWIYLNKHSSEYVRILNVSHVVHSIY